MIMKKTYWSVVLFLKSEKGNMGQSVMVSFHVELEGDFLLDNAFKEVSAILDYIKLNEFVVHELYTQELTKDLFRKGSTYQRSYEIGTVIKSVC